MEIPGWALSLSYWLHLIATVVWIGGLAFVRLVLAPGLEKLSDGAARLQLFEMALKRLDTLGWFSLLLLTGTGLLQMSASPQYEGFLTVQNDWALAILLKHIVFGGMIVVSAYMTWASLPELHRAVLLEIGGKTAPNLAGIQRKNNRLVFLNLLLGLVVLIFTALARVSA